MAALKLSEPASDPIMMVDLAAQQQRISGEIRTAIDRVLAHGQYIMGPEIPALEAALSDLTGARHVVTCSSGTDALLMVLMAKGIGPGDGVLCPAFTFTATPEAVALLGAKVVFVDVDEATFNIDPASIEASILAARAAGIRPRAIMPVDLFGSPADYAAIEPVARAYDLLILCDAAQSLGGGSDTRAVGTFGDVTATSFFPAKPLGCYGDGGAIFTNDLDLAAAMRSIRLHGKGGDKYDIVRLGLNGRLDTLQAAILLEKLKIFPDELDRRDAIASTYSAALAGHVGTPSVLPGHRSSWAQYTIRLPAGRRDEIARRLKADGVPTAVYYPRPLHHQPAYTDEIVPTTGLARSERLSAEVLSLPMHPYLSDCTVERIAGAVIRAVS